MPPIPKYQELLSSEDAELDFESQRTVKPDTFLSVVSIKILLISSLVLNGLLLLRSTKRHATEEDGASIYAGLTQDISRPWELQTPYSSDNLTLAHDMWKKIDEDTGVVAFEDSFVAEKALPYAQRFPWDEKKGLYLLNGYHNLHCLKKLEQSLMEFHLELSQSEYFGHIMHCLDSLRQDVICQADDTPRFTGQVPSRSGIGQRRQCRDWQKLEAWAKDHTACHRHIKISDSVLERFQFCPEGSSYGHQVNEAV